MDKKGTTLAIIGFLGASNLCFAGSTDHLHLLSSNQNKIERSKSNESVDKSSEEQNQESCANTLVMQFDYEQDRLWFDYVFGLLLDFGEGKISIENLKQEIDNKIKACKQKEKTALEKCKEDEGKPLLAKVIREMWEKIGKAVDEDIKRLLDQKANIENIRKKYKEKAINWISSQYGVNHKKESHVSDASSNTKSQ